MRRFLIDTDTGTDDAVALIMALRDPGVKVEAITTVAGNVDVDRATQNALISVERAETYAPPVYKGLGMPILRERIKADKSVHGEDGMGDLNLPKAKLTPADGHAVDFLIRYIEDNPGELEMVTLGPVTNLALICHRSPQTLAKLKKIYMMMGTGTWFGNATPMAEGNASMDPEALDIVLRYAKTEIILVGWDLCTNEYYFTGEDIAAIYAAGSHIAKFCLDINHTLMTLNERRFGVKGIDFADPVAMAVALEPDMVEQSVTAYTRVETNTGLAYGAIAIDYFHRQGRQPNATTCLKLDAQKMKDCIIRRIV